MVYKKIKGIVNFQSRVTFRLHPDFANATCRFRNEMPYDDIACPEPRPIRFKFVNSESKDDSELRFLRSSNVTRETFDTFVRLVGEEEVHKWFNFSRNQVRAVISGAIEIDDLPERRLFL